MRFSTTVRSVAAAALVAGSAATFVPATASAAETRETSAASAQMVAVHPMVSHARAYAGQWGGQCKEFVQRIHNEVYVRDLGRGYWQAYIDAGYHRITKGLTTACCEACPTGARQLVDLKNTNDPVHEFMRTHSVHVLKPNLATGAKVFYNSLDGSVR